MSIFATSNKFDCLFCIETSLFRYEGMMDPQMAKPYRKWERTEE